MTTEGREGCAAWMKQQRWTAHFKSTGEAHTECGKLAVGRESIREGDQEEGAEHGTTAWPRMDVVVVCWEFRFDV